MILILKFVQTHNLFVKCLPTKISEIFMIVAIIYKLLVNNNVKTLFFEYTNIYNIKFDGNFNTIYCLVINIYNILRKFIMRSQNLNSDRFKFNRNSQANENRTKCQIYVDTERS